MWILSVHWGWLSVFSGDRHVVWSEMSSDLLCSKSYLHFVMFVKLPRSVYFHYVGEDDSLKIRRWKTIYYISMFGRPR